MPVLVIDHVRTSDQGREFGLRIRIDETVVVGAEYCGGNVDVADPTP